MKAIVTISAPMIASSFRRRKTADYSRVSHAKARFSFAFGFGLAILLALAGRPLLRMFSSCFEEAHPALTILLAGGLVNAFIGSVCYLLTMSGKYLAAMVIFRLNLLLSATSNLVLIPRFGTVGGTVAPVSGLAF